MPLFFPNGSRFVRRAVRGVVVAAAGLACGVLLAGCGGGTIAHPDAREALIVQVSTGGGLVPVEVNLTQIPEFSLYGDGRVIVTGPVMAIYPGPALPNLQTTVISEKAVQALLEAAQATRLFDPAFDWGSLPIADAATTTVVISAKGGIYRSEIYALGMNEAAGLSAEQEKARAVVAGFLAKLTDLTAFEAEPLTWQPYSYTALAAYSTPVDPGSTDTTDVQPNRVAWPLGDLATLGEAVAPEGYRRVVVTGEELKVLQALLPQATQITRWESGGREYRVLLRPLLPDEAA